MMRSPPDEQSAASVTAIRPAVDGLEVHPRSDQAQFTPGTVIAGRYRIVSLLGRGGMGEVYRAEDMKLGHGVALKFLPRNLPREPEVLERLYAEVRIGRQISHPNVCRLYDIVEAEGYHFITMEYVDGEDLASLLRRIGHLPTNKALDVARALSAGLAAIHDGGVVHRDLKPGNVMIDGRGRARITDFGLAALSEETRASEGFAGTPEYMAPEQFDGKNASEKSDIYALGLIIYEVFTEKRVFEGSISEIAAQKHSGKPPDLTVLRVIDPSVARIVLRCLDRDPGLRPASARAVIAALPGGDPLAAAIAAGETPSPEMVAAAGKADELRPSVAWTYLVVVIAAVLLAAFVSGKTYRNVPLEKSPDVLADRAAAIIARVGYPERPADTASWFSWDDLQRRHRTFHRAQSARKPKWGETLHTPGAPEITFWYRRSPSNMLAMNASQEVDGSDPPESVPGMVSVNLDSDGRLLQLRAVPPQLQQSKSPSLDPNWSVLFSEAGLDAGRFTPTAPKWTPPFGSDRRAAWDGFDPNRGNVPIHVEAAADHGKPVWFQVLGTWTQTAFHEEDPLPALMYILGILGGLIFAQRNVRLGRGDRQGATRIATWMFFLQMLYWVFRADHVPVLNGEFEHAVIATGSALFFAAFTWVLYMALEPYVRRLWPQAIISWSRLVAGRVRDPLVGRDIMIGCVTGALLTLLDETAFFISGFQGLDGPTQTVLEGLRGTRQIAWLFFGALTDSLLLVFVAVFLLIILRVLFGGCAFAAAAIGSLALTTTSVLIAIADYPVGLSLGLAVAFFALFVLVLTRVGILAIFTALVTHLVLLNFPMTLDFSSWYAGRSVFGLGLIATIALYGFYISLAGKPLFAVEMLEE